MRLGHLKYLKIGVAALLVFLLFRHMADPAEVGQLLRSVDPVLFLLSFLFLMVAALVNAVRWWFVLARLAGPAPLRLAVVGTLEAMFFNLFFPSGVGGDAMRAFRSYDAGSHGGDVVRAALVDRALGLWGLSLFILLVAPFSDAMSDVSIWRTILLAALVVVFAGISVAVAARMVTLPRLPKWLLPIAVLAKSLGNVMISRFFVSRVLPSLLASNLTMCISMTLALASVGGALPFADSAIVIQSGTFTSVLPVTVGGWGLREGAIIYLLEQAGVSNATAFATTAVLGVTLILAGLVGMTIWLRAPYVGARRITLPKRRDRTAKEKTVRHTGHEN